MKKLIWVLLAALLLAVLPACGCDDGADADLVFINDSDTTIVSVVTDFVDQSSGVQYADSSPLKRGETFGFEAGVYPVTVLVYDRAVENVKEGELARIVIGKAPPEGERWYITARDGADGLVLAADTCWPEGV